VIPIAGDVASFAEEGSPLNKVAGLGFGGVPSAAALDEVERAFTACGTAVQIELAHLVDPAIGTYESRHPESRSGRPAMTSSTRGSTSWQMASPTPTRKGCPRTRSFRAR
jgi:hypothetical protein